jgi:hypothetical protein
MTHFKWAGVLSAVALVAGLFVLLKVAAAVFKLIFGAAVLAAVAVALLGFLGYRKLSHVVGDADAAPGAGPEGSSW